MKTLLKGSFIEQGININYNVQGPKSPVTNPVFILVLGNVNFSSKLAHIYAKPYGKLAHKNNSFNEKQEAKQKNKVVTPLEAEFVLDHKPAQSHTTEMQAYERVYGECLRGVHF